MNAEGAKLVAALEGYRIEGTPSATDATAEPPGTLLDSERNLKFHTKYFEGSPRAGSEHAVLLGTAKPSGPVVISLVLDGTTYHGLYRSTQGFKLNSVDADTIPFPWYRRLFGLGRDRLVIASALFGSEQLPSLREVRDTAVFAAVKGIDEKQVIKTYKFAVLYAKDGQASEEEMFANSSVSAAFDEFLGIIGDRVKLEGFTGFRGALDVKTNTTGTHSVYKKWRDYEIMYHVSTLLPSKEGDTQQIERKRHLGNDIILIVFKEGNTLYRPDTIKSQQTHVILVVSPEGSDKYRLEFSVRDGVPPFGPAVPQPCIVPRSPEIIDYVLNKLVNGENASYKAPGFHERIGRIREGLLGQIVSDFSK
eukprot:Opistho-2@77407